MRRKLLRQAEFDLALGHTFPHTIATFCEERLLHKLIERNGP
jgi:hypothetical protein